MTDDDPWTEPDPGIDAATQAAGNAIAYVAASMLGIPPGEAAMLAGPSASSVLARIMHRHDEIRVRNIERVLGETAEHLGTDGDGIVVAADTDEKMFLLGQGLDAGAKTVLDQKIKTLGRVVAHGLGGDEAALPVQSMILAALRDMEAPHIKVLAEIGGLTSGDTTRPIAGSSRTYLVLASKFSGYLAALPAILAVLERHGLITRQPQTIDGKNVNWAIRYGSVPTSDKEVWELTTFGVECLQALAPDASE